MIPDGTSHPLPPYRGLLAVDIVKYSRNQDRYLPELSGMLPQVLEEAFTRCELDHVWHERRFPDHPGDGYVFGMSPSHLPFLIHPFLGALQTTLWERAASLRARDRALTLRLRAALHVGPVPDVGDTLHDRKAKATNDAFRMLDSVALRQVMDRTEPDVTLVAAIVSGRVFQDVVESGYTAVHARQFHHVTAEVPEKDFAQDAWIYVPRPTFAETRQEETAQEPREPDTGTDSGADAGAGGAAGASAVFHDRVGQAFTGGTFHGGIHYRES